MNNLFKEYEAAIDGKGRMVLPAGFRKSLAEGATKFVINRGIEKCLTMYMEETWNKLSGKISRMNDLDPKVRSFKRMFINGASDVETDNAGRILINKTLQEHAGISKDVVFSVQGIKVEIWDRDTFYKYVEINSSNYSQLAEEVSKEYAINLFEDL